MLITFSGINLLKGGDVVMVYAVADAGVVIAVFLHEHDRDWFYWRRLRKHSEGELERLVIKEVVLS